MITSSTFFPVNCSIKNKDGKLIPFKKSIETAAVSYLLLHSWLHLMSLSTQVTAWLGTALLLLILLIHIGLLFIYFIVLLRKRPDEENMLLPRREDLNRRERN